MVTIIMVSQRLKTFHIGSSESFYLTRSLFGYPFLKEAVISHSIKKESFRKKNTFFKENGYAKESLVVSTRIIGGVRQRAVSSRGNERNDLKQVLSDHVAVGFAS